MDRLQSLGRLAQKAGPYVLLEMVLPGGTLLALLLYLHQRGHLAPIQQLADRLAHRIGHDLERASLTWEPAAWPVTMNH